MRKSQIRFLVQEDLLEKEMATHASILAWRIPWIEEPSKVQSMGSWTVGHDWATNCIYSSVYVSTSISQFTPSSFAPGNRKCVFYICNSISLL